VNWESAGEVTALCLLSVSQVDLTSLFSRVVSSTSVHWKHIDAIERARLIDSTLC
jgi:hypothetical protein